MVKIAIGLGIVWLVTTITGRTYKTKGIIELALLVFLAYGLGSLTMLILNR